MRYDQLTLEYIRNLDFLADRLKAKFENASPLDLVGHAHDAVAYANIKQALVEVKSSPAYEGALRQERDDPPGEFHKAVMRGYRARAVPGESLKAGPFCQAAIGKGFIMQPCGD